PVKLTITCSGLEPGATVSVSVYEPHGLGGDPVETFDATISDEGFEATAEWTYDHEKHKDDVSGALFLFVIVGAGRTTVSPPMQFVDLFQATLKDDAGQPAANRFVRLHASRGPSVDSETDVDGKTDDQGVASVPNMKWDFLAVKFEAGMVRVPAVHDPALVICVWLPFVEPTGEAPAQDGEGTPHDQVERPAHLFPVGEPGD